MSVYTTDTHALVYYATGKHAQLSRKALRAFKKAEEGSGYIYIPAASIWEISYLEKEGRIRLKQSYNEWMDMLVTRKWVEIVALDEEIIRAAREYSFNDDIFDHVIVATAAVRGTPLITRDSAITDAKVIDVWW